MKTLCAACSINALLVSWGVYIPMQCCRLSGIQYRLLKPHVQERMPLLCQYAIRVRVQRLRALDS